MTRTCWHKDQRKGRLYAELVIDNGEFGCIPPCFSWADVASCTLTLESACRTMEVLPQWWLSHTEPMKPKAACSTLDLKRSMILVIQYNCNRT